MHANNLPSKPAYRFRANRIYWCTERTPWKADRIINAFRPLDRYRIRVPAFGIIQTYMCD